MPIPVRRRVSVSHLGAAILVVALIGSTAIAASAGRSPSSVSAGRTPNLRVGLTHTQYSADRGGNPAALRRAHRLLARLDLQNQFIMGFGVGNPEPRPGVFHWASLDQRVSLMRRSGKPIVLTLCCSPDWMKGGRAGHTDWSTINKAPLPADYRAFAHLAAKVARRYPFVHDFQVWSELRGFYDHDTRTWDVADYTRLYNDVYRALKKVNPKIQVGGPYIKVDSWLSPNAGGWPSSLHGSWGTVDQRPLDVITYWLAHNVGADFISVDGGPDAKDGEQPLSAYPGATNKLTTVDQWIRKQTRLPIWWSEVQLAPRQFYGGMTQSATVTVDILNALADSGARTALLWCGERCGASGDGGRPLWTSTLKSHGGRATAIYHDVIKHLPDYRRRPVER